MIETYRGAIVEYEKKKSGCLKSTRNGGLKLKL